MNHSQDQIENEDEASLLLPWYVNKTLDSEERLLVERHLSESLYCQDQLEMEESIHAVINNTKVNARKSDQAYLNRLFADIEKEEETISSSKTVDQSDSVKQKSFWFKSDKQKKSNRFEFSESFSTANLLKLLLGFQLVTAGLMAFVLVDRNTIDGILYDTDPTFRTLSSETAPASIDAARYKILFSKQAQEGEIRKLLQEIRGEIVSGPSLNGVYSVDVKGEELIKINYSSEGLLNYLRNDPSIVFVELLYSPEN